MTKEDFEGTNLHLSRGRNRQIKRGLRGRKSGEAGDLNVLLRHRDAGCVGVRVGSEEERETATTAAAALRQTRHRCRSLSDRQSVSPLVCDATNIEASYVDVEYRKGSAREANLHNEIWAGEKGLVFLATDFPTYETCLAPVVDSS